MSSVDWSSKFSYNSGIAPVLSNDGRHTAYLDGNSLVIRSIDTLGVIKSVKLGNNAVLKGKRIHWSSGDRVGLLLSEGCKIVVVDLFDHAFKWEIMEDELLGIEDFEFINDSLIVVFNECGLRCGMFSDKAESDPVRTLDFPEISTIRRKQDDLFTIFSRGNRINYYCKDNLLYYVDLDVSINIVEIMNWSSSGSWLFLYDSSIMGELIFYIFDPINKKPIFTFRDKSQKLGLQEQIWKSDNTFLISLFNEEIWEFEISTGLKITNKFKHGINELIKSSNVFKIDNYNEFMSLTSTNFTIPSIELNLDEKQVKFKSNNEYLFTNCKTMSNTLFIWRYNDLDSTIIVNSGIKQIETFKKPDLSSLVLIIEIDSICIWFKNLNSPIYLKIGKMVRFARIINVVNNLAEILVVLKDDFAILQIQLPVKED